MVIFKMRVTKEEILFLFGRNSGVIGFLGFYQRF